MGQTSRKPKRLYDGAEDSEVTTSCHSCCHATVTAVTIPDKLNRKDAQKNSPASTASFNERTQAGK